MSKAKPNKAIKALRAVIGRTQAQFATLIGVTKDAVVNWENGRTGLSKYFAMRIEFVTGVSAQDLLANRTPPRHCRLNRPYSATDWENHHADPEGLEDSLADFSVIDLQALLEAAKIPGRGKLKHRLPGIVYSFMQWARQTTKDFQLESELSKVLAPLRIPSGIPQFALHLDPELWRRIRRGTRPGIIARESPQDLLKDFRPKPDSQDEP